MYYRITSLSYATVELAGFIKGQDRDSIVVPSQIYDTISGRYFKVTSVAPDAFEGQKELKSVTLPTTVTRIGSHAFAGTSVEEAVIPGSVYHVEEGAYATPTLKSVHIYAPGEDGSSTRNAHSIELQNNAFGTADEGNLSDVYVGYADPPIVEDGVTPFPQLAAHPSSAKLHLSAEAKEDDYKNANCWQDFYRLDPTGIADVETDAANAVAQYYTMQGCPVSASDLYPGIYIVKKGNKVSKTIIR